MPTLDRSAVDVVAVSAAVVASAALALAVAAHLRLQRYLGSAGMPGGAGAAGGPAAVPRQLERLAASMTALDRRVDGLAAYAPGALRHVAVVRYDAFREMGGRTSFSAAVLDERGDGLVLTAISGRTESRTYAKPVLDGAGQLPLSPEEQEAVTAAMAQRRGAAGRSRPAPAPAGNLET